MEINILKSKIHRATVTEANLNYVGSITIDKNLMEQANVMEYEKVQVVDMDNGARLETYVIAGERGSGVICLNGGAARLVQKGDSVILIFYCSMTVEEAREHRPIVVFVDIENNVREVKRYEMAGKLSDDI